MKQQPLRFFVVDPLKALRGIVADRLIRLGIYLLQAAGIAIAIFLVTGLGFLLYLLISANILISLVFFGVVALVLVVLALLFW